MLTIYKASAGSGKTFTLAKTYITQLLGIKMHSPQSCGDGSAVHDYMVINLKTDEKEPRLQENNRHRSILAITFTRKATEEMKRRILDELHHLSQMPAPGAKDSPYAKDLLDIFNQQPAHCTRAQLATTAKLALQQLLFDYRNFNVSTIDSFFQQVLRTFARELDFNANYNVELEDKNVIKAAVGMMLDDFNAPDDKVAHDTQKHPANLKSLEEWLYQHMLSKMPAGTNVNVFNRKGGAHSDLIKLLLNMDKEEFKDSKDKMEKYLLSGKLGSLGKEIDDYLAKKKNAITTAAKIKLKESGLKPEMFDGRTALNKITEKLSADDCNPLEFEDVKKLPDSKSGCAAIGRGEGKITKKAYAAEYDEKAIEFFSWLYKQLIALPTIDIIKGNLPQLNLLAYSWNYLKEYIKENDLLLLSDSNELVKKIIGDDTTPFVYERMGVNLKHFLIDEFQDTSHMQWDNLKPLIANALSTDDDSLVIGDEKQSIYRFRNSDSSILHDKINTDFPNYQRQTRGSSAAENTNYRSSADIVRFNNTLFSRLAQNLEVSEYGNVVQGIRPEYLDYKGYVRFCFHEKDKDADSVFEEMAQEILRQHDQGKYLWKDIAVLVNKRDEGYAVVNFLAINYPQIPLLSEDSLSLASSSAVQLILSMLRMINQKLSNAKTKPKQLIINNIEYALALHIGKLKEGEELNQDDVTRIILDVIDEHASKDDETDFDPAQNPYPKSASLVAMVEAIIGQQFTPQQRAKQFTYLSAFQDTVLTFGQNYDGGLQAFLDWWDERWEKITINGAADADAVKVMTIHKSKGLEFHCVHVPICDWYLYWSPRNNPKLWIKTEKFNLNDSELELPPAVYVELKKEMADPDFVLKDIYLSEKSKALSDCLNKTYVAFTRPRSELMAWVPYDNASSQKIGQGLYVAMTTGYDDANSNPLKTPIALDTASGTLTLGQPTHNIDADKQTPEPECDNPDPYPVVHRTDNATKIELDDILGLEDDIDGEKESTETQLHPSIEWLDEGARAQGLILHDIMANIYTLSDIGKSVEKVGTRLQLSREHKDYYQQMLTKFLHPDKQNMQRWFGENQGVYIEQPIYLPQYDKVRRPDRVVVYADGSADVLDYKFTDNHEIIGCDDHKKQLSNYTWYVKNLGYNPVRGFLCYPLLDQIVMI